MGTHIHTHTHHSRRRVCDNTTQAIMAPPELFYFDGTGRAQITRLIFTLGKHEFVDHRLSFPEHAKNKADPSHPVSQKYGSMPVLKDGDFLLAQSLAIATYAAEVALPGYKDLTAKQHAIDQDYLHSQQDVLEALYKCIFGTDESKKAGAEAFPGVVDRFFSKIEAELAKRGEGHYTHGGDKPSLGDLALFDIVTKINEMGVPLKKYPCVLAIAAKVEALEGVKALYKL